ncbi:MAG: secretin N-terminal domain-containing protein [Alphaproteobacteria bacterium]
MYIARFFLIFLLSLLSLQGCALPSRVVGNGDIDPSGGLTRNDYTALRDRQPADADEPNKKPATQIPPIPSMPGGEMAESVPDSALNKLVSLTVTDSVPVRDVLMELMRKTGANLELDPRVQGSVIITAHEQPLGEVLQRVCTLAGLRYTVDGNFIHVEPDEPYQKTYQLDYLSLSRRTDSATAIATNVFDTDVGGTSATGGAASGGSQGSSTAMENNSTAKVSGRSDADFWAETDKSIAQILSSNERKPGSKINYSIDKQAGMVTIYGDQKQQDAIATYFDKLRHKANAQVLIDARIIEIELDDDYQAGIDWGAVIGKAFGVAANFGAAPALGTNGFFTAGITGSNFTSVINLVQTFGTTRVLSAPRVTVLNNQTAVMKVATNQVYFITQAQFTTTTNANGSSVTTNPVYTSTPHTVPVGLVMTVQPAIDPTTNRVTMTLRPTISRVVGEVNDPSISLNAAVAGVSSPIQSQIPVLAVREMDSVLQLHSGEIAIMGGLMQDSSINQDQGVPWLDNLSYAGNLFKSRNNQGTTTELVILLRATIADQPAPDDADKNLYHYYNKDPRPLSIPDLNPRLKPDKSDDDQT